MDPADIEDLFDQLEDYSDSGPDADTISIGSTPKPSLKPFFCSSRNLLHEARSVVAAAAVAKAQSELYFSIAIIRPTYILGVQVRNMKMVFNISTLGAGVESGNEH